MRLPEDRNWEIVIQEDKPRRLTVNENGEVEMLPLWQYECDRGHTFDAPEPKPPTYCGECQHKRMFFPKFPDELKALYGSRLHAPWLLPTEPKDCDFLALFAEIQDYVRKHLVLAKEEQYDIVALWIMATWKVDDFLYCPYILFRGEIESGKTRALNVINRLGYHTIPTVGATPAVVRKQVQWFRCTCAIDQAEDQLNRKFEAGQAMYRLVAAGYKKGMFVARCREGHPDKIDYDDPFGFKAFASTKSFDAAIDSRSIIIDMEEAEPENLDLDEAWARDLRAKLLYWRLSEDFIPTIVDTQLRGRTRELFMSLLSLGDFTDCKDRVEKFALEHQLARKMELLDELKAAIVDVVWKQMDTSPDGRVHISEIKDTLTERGLQISSSFIGRNCSDLGLPRQQSVKGRYLDVTDDEIIKKIDYWTKKYGLKKEPKEAQNELISEGNEGN